ncbi:MAG: glycosyltransferase [Verrucomicrobiota bacterium]|nr:glycosyltransferase [Verrucomicrobiota bacterium]
MTPLITVIIPNYNREALLPVAINSVIKQLPEDSEIIVVDDGSTDGSVAAARAYGRQVTVVCQANQGPGAARNLGLSRATGEFVQFLDSDDLLAEGSIGAACSLLQQSGADIAIGCWVKGRFLSKTEFHPANGVYQAHGLPIGQDLVYWLLTHWSVVPHQMLIRRSIIERTSGFPVDLRLAEDQEFFLRCLLEGARVVWCPDFLMLYREGNSGKLSEGDTVRKGGDWARFLIRARTLCLESGRTDPLQWLGYRLRVWQACEDLRRAGVTGELVDTLSKLLHGHDTPLLYKLVRHYWSIRGGFQQRLTGGRAHPCFRIGKLTAQQRERIRKSGYSVKA